MPCGISSLLATKPSAAVNDGMSSDSALDMMMKLAPVVPHIVRPLIVGFVSNSPFKNLRNGLTVSLSSRLKRELFLPRFAGSTG